MPNEAILESSVSIDSKSGTAPSQDFASYNELAVGTHTIIATLCSSQTLVKCNQGPSLSYRSAVMVLHFPISLQSWFFTFLSLCSLFSGLNSF